MIKSSRFFFRSMVLFVMAVILLGSVPPVIAGQGGADFLSDEFYTDQPGSVETADPLESLNRVVFTFNDRMYTWVLEPVARGYSHVLPSDIRSCFSTFFRNLLEPVRFINTLLQGRFADSRTVLVRFLINSTCGIYGFADVAAREFNFPPVEATLGQTLATWGVGDGCYLVVPLYGSSTLRDFVGVVGDGFGMTPYYYPWTRDFGVMAGVYLGKETNRLSLHLGDYEELKKLSFDPYVALRDAYFQYRRKQRQHSTSPETLWESGRSDLSKP
ncbi:MAG: VacJ family lipoprotein [Deltaproteobacteria bacterium]|nr:VacJ family lipoprotein [Deltaproteobacteria bacterium]